MYGYPNFLGYGIELRIAVSKNGNITIAAPSSGTGLSVSASGTGNIAISADDGGANSVVVRPGATSAINASGAWNLSVGGNASISMASTRAVTVQAPTSGVALTVTAFSTSNSIAADNGITVTQNSASTGANLFLNGGPSGSTINRLRYTSNAAGNNNFAIRDDTTGADRLAINSNGGVTVNAPSSANTPFTVNALTGQETILATGDMGGADGLRIQNTSGTDGRATISFVNNLTTAQQWTIGIDPSGGTTKAFALRDLTRGALPITVSINGNVTIATPASGTALTVTGGISTDTLTASSTVSGAGITSLFASPPAIGGTAAAAGSFTTLTASSTVSGAGITSLFASPPAIGGTVAAAGSFTTLGATGNFTSKKITDNGNVTIAAPASGVALTVNAVSGTHSTQIDDSAGNAFNAGYLEVPVGNHATPYTAVLADSGKTLYYNGTGAATFTIPANASVAYPVGTVLTFVNDATGATNMTIAITSDTMILAGTTTTGSRTLSQGGMATALKLTSTRWIISGSGLT